MCDHRQFISNQTPFSAFLMFLLLFVSGSLYADVTSTGSQSPVNPVTPGINPVYTITMTNLDPSGGVFPSIEIQHNGIDISGAFISVPSTFTCSADGIFFCDQLLPSATQSYQFQWATTPLEGDYPLTFIVDCGSECFADSVAITTSVSFAPDVPSLPVLTESEQAVSDSLQSACDNLLSDSFVASTVGENNLREACLALQSLDDAALANAVIQLTPKQGPAQGTSAIEANNRQFDNITSRMAALRGGASGISFNGLNLQYQDLSLPGSLFVNHSDVPSGGSAGEDGPLLIGKYGFFINGSVSLGDKASTSNELGFDVDTTGITAGIDYRYSDQFIAGGAFGYVNNETDFDSNSGNMDVDGFTLSVYSTYYHDENTYMDAIFSLGWNDFSNTRSLSIGSGSPTAEVKGDSEGQEYSLSIGGGYDFYHENISFGPLVRINYIKADIDSYAESTTTGFELDYASQDVESLTTTLGGQISYAISTSKGIFTPQLIFEWAHEFKNDSRFITASFLYDTSGSALPFNLQTDDPERDYLNLGVGLSATFAAGKSAFIFYETNLQRDDIDVDTISAGLRLTF